MNGPHDLGGQMGFGPVTPEKNEPVFHADWEKRALGITICCDALGAWTIDESRYSVECIAPVDYLAGSYYQNWIRGLDVLLERHGLASRAELFSGRQERDEPRSKNKLTPDQVTAMLASGPSQQPVATRPAFAPGQKVRTKNINPVTHTRLPRYARGRAAIVETIQGSYAFPDDSAHGKGANPQWLYTIAFPAEELWGDGADRSVTVSIDAWESYLERF